MMSALREWQQQFLRAVVEGYDPQWQVHRNNWRCNLRAALQAGYPAIERLVGVEFFAHCADRYIDAYPSRSSNLENYGADFSEFLRAFEPAQSLPYLSDVAELELAIEQLLTVPDDHAQIVIRSPYPILTIWQMNQPDAVSDATISLDNGGEIVRVYRAGVSVFMETIAAEKWSMENGSSEQRPIEEMAMDAQNAESPATVFARVQPTATED